MSVNVPPMSTPTLNKVVCPRVILPPVPSAVKERAPDTGGETSRGGHLV